MRRALSLIAAVALAGLILHTVPASSAAEPLSLHVTPAATDVRLGQHIELELVVRNPGDIPVTVPTLRLAADAVSVDVEGDGMASATVTRLYGEFVERGGEVDFEPRASRPVQVPPGGKISGSVRFAAVVPGTLSLTAKLARAGGSSLIADPIEVAVGSVSGPTRLVARVETTRNPVTIELDGARAFNSVSHFWSLARSGFYGDLPFHRVLAGLLVQTGDPRGDGTGTAGWYLPAEPADTPLERGAVALARGPHADSASSQWFVTLSDGDRALERLPGRFAVIGKVVEGLDIMDTLAEAESDPATGRPSRPDRLLRIRTDVR